MARPKGTNTVAAFLNDVPEPIKDKGTGSTKKFVKTLTFDPEMKERMAAEAKKRGMTMAGFIKYAIVKVMNENLQ